MIDGIVHPAFAPVADRFRKLFRKPSQGGGALAVQLGDEVVVDIWAGYVDSAGKRPWASDTMVMCFSTTKGVASTVLHQLHDQGLLDYDTPVADYWPAFGEAGKDAITVRELMTHRAGLHRIRGLVSHAEEMLDADAMIELLAGRPSERRDGHPGYHGLTYGWLVDGLARAITGTPIAELVQTQIAEPLDLDGCYIGVPLSERARVSPLLERPGAVRLMQTLNNNAHRLKRLRPLADALIVEGFDELMHDPRLPLLDTSMPAANGVFTARSLARMYAALANEGVSDGVKILSKETLLQAGRVQTRKRDYVIGVPMRWRLGYHQAFVRGSLPRMAFGHFGYGGSGAWADPETGMSVAFVTNRIGGATTPVADARLASLGSAALSAATHIV